MDWEQRYPVIKLDWSLISHLSREALEESTATYMRTLAGHYQIRLNQNRADACFGELIQCLHQKTGKQVVMLVDEYDMPIYRMP
jgi:hypothetical protein